VNTPSNNFTNFCASTDPESHTRFCNDNAISIQPFRLAILPSKALTPVRPAHLNDLGSYVIRKLRRGFVYIYIDAPEDSKTSTSADGSWFVFRYHGPQEDRYDFVAPEDTDTANRNPGSFSQYSWEKDLGPEGLWAYSGKPATAACWVPSWTSEVWIAYSEFRWPASFFLDCKSDPSFREKIMQHVGVREPNPFEFGAFIGAIPTLVEEYKKPFQRDVMVEEELKMSFETFRPTSNSRYEDISKLTYADARRMVALFDPVADVHEVNQVWAEKLKVATAFNNEFLYPLTTGAFAKSLAPNLPERKSTDFLNPPALKSGWEPEYDRLAEIRRVNEAAEAASLSSLEAVTFQDGPCTFAVQMDLATKAAQNGDPSAALYLGLLSASTTHMMCMTPLGQEHLAKNLTVPTPFSSRDTTKTLNRLVNNLRLAWSGHRKQFYETIRRRHYAFDIVFRQITPSLSREIAKGLVNFKDWKNLILNGYFNGEPKKIDVRLVNVDFDSALAALTSTVDPSKRLLLSGEIYAFDELGKPLPDTTPEDHAALRQRQAVKSQLRVNTIRNIRPNLKIPQLFVEELRIDYHPDKVAPWMAIRRFELGYETLGFFSVLVSVYMLATAGKDTWDKQFKHGDFVQIFNSREFRALATATWLVEGAYSIVAAKKYLPTSSATIGANGLKILFDTASEKLSKPNKQLLSAIVPKYYRSDKALLLGDSLRRMARVSIIIGAFVDAGVLVKAIEREDRADIVGNALALVGGLLFLPFFPTYMKIIGGLMLFVGNVLIRSLVYSDVEDIVRLSFWGSSSSYWGLKDRPDFGKLIETARVMAAEPGQTADLGGTIFTPDSVTKAFNKEMEMLNELTWYPEVVEDGLERHGFWVLSPAITKMSANDPPGSQLVKIQVENVDTAPNWFPSGADELFGPGPQFWPVPDIGLSYHYDEGAVFVTVPEYAKHILVEVSVSGKMTTIAYSVKAEIKFP
jgi:hypothetical protein